MLRSLLATFAIVLTCCAHAAPPAAASPRADASAPPALRDFSGEELRRIRRLQPIVRRAARKHGVPWPLVDGVIWVESKFQTRARGKRGPRGLMQLMPRTGRAIARELGRRYRPRSADFNVHAGTYYLSTMLRRFDGDRTLALCAYHRGPGAVQRWLASESPMPGRSRRYVDRVLAAAKAFRARL